MTKDLVADRCRRVDKHPIARLNETTVDVRQRHKKKTCKSHALRNFISLGETSLIYLRREKVRVYSAVSKW